MSKYKYREVPGTMKNLFTRQLASDEVNKTAAWADHIIELVRNELSEQDLAQLKKLLAGGELDEDAPIESRRAGAQDSRSARIDQAGFDALFPSAKRIGRDPLYHFR